MGFGTVLLYCSACLRLIFRAKTLDTGRTCAVMHSAYPAPSEDSVSALLSVQHTDTKKTVKQKRKIPSFRSGIRVRLFRGYASK